MLSHNENMLRLAQAWRATAQGNNIAAIFVAQGGLVLLTKSVVKGESELAFPTARGHGPRPDYHTPIARLAQHYHCSMQLNTLQHVGNFPDGEEHLNVVCMLVPAISPFTPADGQWVTVAELAKLTGVSQVVSQALLLLQSLLESLSTAETAVEETPLPEATVAPEAKPKRKRPSRARATAEVTVAKLEYVQ